MKNKNDSFDAEYFLNNHSVDAFLVSNHFNILYLSHFEGLSPTEREAFIFITKKDSYFITDGRYVNEKSIFPFFKRLTIDVGHSVSSFIQSICLEKGIKTVGFEAGDLSWKEADTLSKIPVTFAPKIEPLKELREQKINAELEALTKACRIGDKAFGEIIPLIAVGKTERELAWRLEEIIRTKYGAEIAFDPMVAVGENAALPHYNTKRGAGIIEKNSLLLIDFGVKWHGYCSDMTRMVAVGEVGSEERHAYEVLKEVQSNARDEIKEFIYLSDIDLFCRSALEKKGFGSYPHSTGHGVGLEIHEGPRISAISKDKKKTHQVFTIEPGIYVPQKWGMRMEDTVTVLPSGAVAELTRFSRELIQV